MGGEGSGVAIGGSWEVSVTSGKTSGELARSGVRKEGGDDDRVLGFVTGNGPNSISNYPEATQFHLPKLSSISANSRSELKRLAGDRLGLAGIHGGLWLGGVSESVTASESDTQKFDVTCSGSGRSSRSLLLKVINVSGSGMNPVFTWN